MNRKVHQACLLLGSNIFPEKNIPLAVKRLQEIVNLQSVSTVWETPAVGSSGPNFLNVALLILTHLHTDQLKNQVLRTIEKELGRIRTDDKFAPRTIDMDIIAWDGIVLDKELWYQVHVAVPVSEVLPGLKFPHNGESLPSIASRLAQSTYISPQRKILPNHSISQGSNFLA
jgi:2-amino-4-hydroxy-6-hydroxymethyldihydropteridine diphosphokinase